MPCGKQFDIWKEAEQAQDRWINSKVLEKWEFTNDLNAFKRLFETATGKVLMSGEHLQPKDFKKFDIAIQTLEKDLQNPGVLSNSILKHFYVGQAHTMRNPITKSFYETLINANEFRNRHNVELMSNYNILISDLKLAIMEFKGQDTYGIAEGGFQARDIMSINSIKSKFKANKVFRDLNKHETALSKKMLEGEGVESTAQEMQAVFKFLENEGATFQDFMDRVTSGNDLILKARYKDKKAETAGYINKINNAAKAWDAIQKESQTMFIQSIKNLSDTINLKYGKKSRTAEFLIKEYDKIRSKLEKSEDGYIPHYVLDILGQSLEISERMAKSKSDTERNDILGEYVQKSQEINTNLSQRLKAKSKEPNEYFSRNPLLYASKYIEQVTQFNHNSFVDKAYTQGLQQLTKVGMKLDGKEQGAAKVYLDIFNDLYSEATNKNRRVDQSDTADNLVRLITSMQFVSKLGLSTRGALRNGTQRFLNFAYFGGLTWSDALIQFKSRPEYKKAMEDELHYHGLEFVDISKVTEGAVTASDLTAHGIDFQKGTLTFNDKETVLSMLTKGGVKLANASSIMTRALENSNRKSTFGVAFHKRAEQLRKTKEYEFVEAGSQKEKDMYRNAGNYASKMVSLLHFEYSPFGKAKILRTKPGAILGQFGHYALSFANLQAQMVKDYKRAFKAGDYTGEEAGRLVRLGLMYGLTELVGGAFDMNLTSYIQNDTLDRSLELIRFLTGDEETSKEAFYGKGLVGAAGLVPISDLIELHNLGAAAGYWNMLADEESTMGWLMGMREYDRIDNKEFLGEVGGMFSIEAERLIRRTGPAFFYKGNVFTNMVTAELGLYPGTTTLGFKTRDIRKKIMKAAQGKDTVDKSRSYKWSPYSNKAATKALDNF